MTNLADVKLLADVKRSPQFKAACVAASKVLNRDTSFTPDISQANGKATFPSPVAHFRDWGVEILAVVAEGKYTLKRIEMKEGAKGGLQYHHKKDEAGIMISGDMLVRYDVGDGQLTERVLHEGDCFRFPAGAVHQSEALTPVVYIEVSTPFLNDRVHVERLYGVEEEAGGLPTTLPHEVQAV